MGIKIPFSTNLEDMNQQISTQFLPKDSENYYRLNFANVPYEVYWYADNAKQAVLDATDELLDNGESNNVGACTVRRAVYGEWDCEPKHFHNDGSHSHSYN